MMYFNKIVYIFSYSLWTSCILRIQVSIFGHPCPSLFSLHLNFQTTHLVNHETTVQIVQVYRWNVPGYSILVCLKFKGNKLRHSIKCRNGHQKKRIRKKMYL